VRILQTNFHRGWGGQPSRILMMSRVMAAGGHDVVLAAPPGSMLAGRARQAGLQVFEGLAFRKPKFLLDALHDTGALARHLRRMHYDLIDAHGSQDLWTCVAARGLAGRRAPLVFTRHNTKRVRAHAANRWLYRSQVDHVIAASDSVLERYDALFTGGALGRDRVSVVPSAYQPDRFHPGVDGSGVRAELAYSGAVPLIGVVGRLVADKGQDDFLRAAAMVLESRKDARFLIVGTGSRATDLEGLARTLGIGHAVRFLGFREDVPAITAALDVSVLPSVDCDASSAVLKEALACGVPSVATSIGGAAEIVRDGETGLIVPPRQPGRLAAAILTLIENPGRAREMGRRGSQDVARRFTPERLAAETLRVYQTVVERFIKRRAG